MRTSQKVVSGELQNYSWDHFVPESAPLGYLSELCCRAHGAIWCCTESQDVRAAAAMLHNIHAPHVSLLQVGHLYDAVRSHGGSADVKVHPAAEAMTMRKKSLQHL